MQTEIPASTTLTERTVLVAPSAPSDLVKELMDLGARVLPWPEFKLTPPENSEDLDQAIEHLFGYDWLIFRNENASESFIKRFLGRGHEMAELDGLRICGVGEATVHKLVTSQVHVDVVPTALSSQATFEAIAEYVGGREDLAAVNFLVPIAGATAGYLKEMLEEAGARPDLVTAYRTCGSQDDSARISALLAGGGIDVVVFTTPFELEDCAQVFDTGDLDRLLTGTPVVCLVQEASLRAAEFGLITPFFDQPAGPKLLTRAIALALSH